MQTLDNQFILHPKLVTVMVWCQSFVVKACFTLKTDKKTHFYMESIVYLYLNILEGPDSYFSLSMNDYTDVLIFY